MVYFRSSVTLLLLYADNISAASSKTQKQTIKQYQERLKAAFGENLDSEKLQVRVESSIGFLSPDKKQKRDVETKTQDYRFNENADPFIDYDTPIYDEDGQRMKLDPALSNPKSKVDTGKDRKRSRSEHAYYREEYGYECYDTIEDQYFRRGDSWTTVRNLTDHSGVVAGVTAYYSCKCEGGDTGRYICRPTQVPCFSKYTGKYHAVGSQFDIETEKDEYLCYCYGGATGRYECEEKTHGCFDDQWTKQKYRINEKFEQTRDDGLTYDCECQYGSRVQERVIICRLARYCQIDDDIIMIGDTFDIYGADGSVQHRCTCQKGDRYTNKLECKAQPKRATPPPQVTEPYVEQIAEAAAESDRDDNPYENEVNVNNLPEPEQLYIGDYNSLEEDLEGVQPLPLDELERMAYDESQFRYDDDYQGY